MKLECADRITTDLSLLRAEGNFRPGGFIAQGPHLQGGRHGLAGRGTDYQNAKGALRVDHMTRGITFPGSGARGLLGADRCRRR